MVADTLSIITRVPQHHVLISRLSGNRPCIAQIMSWASKWTMARVEDKAYSLVGLLDVNMTMLYGERKQAINCLQLEFIRMSNHQSIFAWCWHEANVQTGSILADDPSFFENCSEMELMFSPEKLSILSTNTSLQKNYSWWPRLLGYILFHEPCHPNLVGPLFLS